MTVRATKTGTTRYVLLAGDPTSDIAPRFLELLRAWRSADPAREYVLPSIGSSSEFTQGWDRVASAADLHVGPEGCRRTFESALDPLRVLARALTPRQVAAKRYLAYAPGRLPDRTVEEVLGLVPFIERATERAWAGRAFRTVAGIIG